MAPILSPSVIMITLYRLKPRFQRSLQGAVNGCARLGMTANGITLSAAVMSMLLGIVLARFAHIPVVWLALPPFLLLRMALNAIDGMLARQYRQQSALGGLLNEVGDVVSDAVLYLPFACLPGVTAAGVVAVVLLAGLTEFVGVAAVAIGATRRHDGPMGKSDRAFWLGVCGLGVGLGFPIVWINRLLWLLVALLLLTAWNRARRALQECA